MKAADEGRQVEFIELAEILDRLSVTQEQLSKKNHVRRILEKKKQRSYHESQPSTLGELLKAKGVDISKII